MLSAPRFTSYATTSVTDISAVSRVRCRSTWWWMTEMASLPYHLSPSPPVTTTLTHTASRNTAVLKITSVYYLIISLSSHPFFIILSLFVLSLCFNLIIRKSYHLFIVLSFVYYLIIFFIVLSFVYCLIICLLSYQLFIFLPFVYFLICCLLSYHLFIILSFVYCPISCLVSYQLFIVL